MKGKVDLLDLLRRTRQSAGDQRKIFLALYGFLIFVPVALAVVAGGRAALLGDLPAQLGATFLRPFLATAELFGGAWRAGAWALMGLVALGLWIAALGVGSFFGLAVTRMAAVELTCDRRADLREALRFARVHWHWAFLTPTCLLLGSLLLLAAAAALFSLGRVSDWLILFAAPAGMVLCLASVILLLGLFAGGMLAWPTIATEWSDAFDAITRVYGYSFAHWYRVLFYRAGFGLALLGAVVTRGLRTGLVLGGFYLVLLVGLGREATARLLEGVLLEPPQGLPFPQTVAGWTILSCVAILLTLLVARLLVFRVVLRQAIYLLLRLRIDKVPMDNIDGYRPDDSAYDPTAQGFELVEVEEEIPAE